MLLATESAGATGATTVLIGSGWTGAVGLAAAIDLAGGDARVQVVFGGEDGVADPALEPLRAEAQDLGIGVRPFGGTLPPSGVVVDALVGRGLEGALRGVPLAIVHARCACSSCWSSPSTSPAGWTPRRAWWASCSRPT